MHEYGLDHHLASVRAINIPVLELLKDSKGLIGNSSCGIIEASLYRLPVINIDSERNLLLVKGAIPGPNNGMVLIREAKRLNRKKQNAAS